MIGNRKKRKSLFKRNERGYPMASNRSSLRFAKGKKKIPATGRILAWGTALSLSAATALGGRALLNRNVEAGQRQARIHKTVKANGFRPKFNWVKLSEKYGLDPKYSAHAKAMIGVEKLSSKMDLEPERILNTIRANKKYIVGKDSNGVRIFDKEKLAKEIDGLVDQKRRNFPQAGPNFRLSRIITILKWAEKNPQSTMAICGH